MGAARLTLVLLASPLHVLALSDTYYVLKHLYEETDGANWKNNENWLNGEPCQNNWMSSSHYDCFSGDMMNEAQPVCCKASTGSLATVVKLDLYGNRLSGTIPKELKELEYLRLLVLDSNSLYGTIPPEIGDMYYLKVLWLQENALSGTIPTELKQYLGAYDKKVGYTFDPGGLILRPNRFNCSVIDGEGMEWANASIDELFRDQVAPDEYAVDENADRGCVVDDDIGAGDGNNQTSVPAQETVTLRETVEDQPLVAVAIIFSVTAGVVILIEILKRAVRALIRRKGGKTEEELEAEDAEKQRLTVVLKNQREQQAREQDRLLEEEAAAAKEAKARRKSRASKDEKKSGRRRRIACCGGGANKAARPLVVGVMGNLRRTSVSGAANAPVSTDKSAQKGRRASLFGARLSGPRTSQAAPMGSVASGKEASSSIDSQLRGCSSRPTIVSQLRDSRRHPSTGGSQLRDSSRRPSIDSQLRDSSRRASIDSQLRDSSRRASIDSQLRDSSRPSIDSQLRDRSSRPSIDSQLRASSSRAQSNNIIADDV
jgi:hypothetical protein